MTIALRKSLVALCVLAGLVAAVVGTTFAVTSRSPHPVAVASLPSEQLAAQIDRSRRDLDRVPANPAGWAKLGSSYVELARITGDPANYGAAQRALDRSLELLPDGNADALIGLGVLANALHNFGAARDYGQQALALRPDSTDVYGVLVDAYTQLGDTDAATAAVQRMLDLRPGVASFTRAAYDLELHGRVDDARTALEMALAAAHSGDQIAYCRYHLGELAFNSGRLDEAETQYRAGLLADPSSAALHQGQAKVFAARGRLDRAIDEYAQLTSTSPLPEYLIEYGELLEAAGRPDAAALRFADVARRFAALAAEGATDNIDSALLAADHGDPAEAVRLAQLEYARRQNLISTDALAWALHRAGRDTEALTYADRTTTLGYRSAAFTYHRGMILAALGRTEEAAAVLSEALRINPYFSPLHADSARKTLAALTGPS
ncbi:tetratricopeptide repeat protein [Nocardia yamanashiensis]|uniref:tetratricopeptide repeat protein n=1 Tax=Nocardia yamanashiensis TaxID=209247 RepID=UPI001E339AD9|nr:tetratricopeptide repeat protein [Nocardia yamanashiensis]UGT42614.1 tetratricopeptide repeat protein [Nocardia yamanashiensis]